jgi:hypothetical protein
MHLNGWDFDYHGLDEPEVWNLLSMRELRH